MKNIFLFSLSVSLMLAACNQHPGSKVRVKKISSARGYFTEFTYTPDGNIATSVNSDGIKTTYKFTGNTIAESIVDSLHNISLASTVFLNSKGLADSTVGHDERESYTQTFKRNAEGSIEETKDFAAGRMSDMTKSIIKDGNLAQVTVMDSSEQPMVRIYFDYYTDKPNTLGYENHGMKFMGNDSKNLTKKLVQVLPKGDTMRVNNFYYHFDKEGRVSQKVIYDARGTMADSTTFTY